VSSQYISASRRNDLPRFHADSFFTAWRKGEITYDGGYGRTYTVSLRPQDVLGYIFWSKDFSRFLSHPDFARLIDRNNAVFHFTINHMPALEPGPAPLEQRLETLARLCKTVGAQRVFWRFDPICRYRAPDGSLCGTEEGFFNLLPFVSARGVRRCYFSFMTGYNKLRRRSVEFGQFTEQEKKEIGERMLEATRKTGMQLYNCCNEEIPRLVPGIRQAHCVDERILAETDRFGVHRSLKPRPTRNGCGCYESRDIGSYDPPCAHGCLYCYANPVKSG
jgi:hypothetical protein